MIVKIHISPDGRKIVAICDNELIGKKVEGGRLQLDMSSGFYKGKEMNEKQVSELLKEPCILNVVGEKSIDLLIRKGIVDKKSLIKINNVPHVQAIIE